MIFLAFPLLQATAERAVAYVRATNYHKLILMQATAERAIGGGFRQNSDSELKLKNRCTGSTPPQRKMASIPEDVVLQMDWNAEHKTKD